jgi:nitroimidazol reductase NimA-like FMN-containing flavoprotein (pyridoxamine 5'-phosphate oxidase superfamily)
LSALTFSTPITTRKFRLLEESSQVALVIDNRSLHPDDMMQVEAVTVTGRATLLEEPEARCEWSRRIAERHAYLRDFLKSPSTAVFRVDVCRYFYVTRFQEVMQWIPGRTG